jgi:hypothetical protein
MKRIVIVSDLQVPFHDRVAVKNLASFISKFKPHEVVTIGDEIDFNTISKWSEGTPESYEQTLGVDSDDAIQVLYDLQLTQRIRSDHKELR